VVKDKIMKSGYIYFTNDEIRKMKTLLSKANDMDSLSLLDKLEFYGKKFEDSDPLVHKQAVDKYTNATEDIVIDDDALVSKSKAGSYVMAWVWVETKVRKKRKKAEVES
jgi:hypothetical protein